MNRSVSMDMKISLEVSLLCMKTFKNMALAPFASLRFRDVYVADVLTSFNRITADAVYAGCYVVSGSFAAPWHHEDPLQGRQTSTRFGALFVQCVDPSQSSHNRYMAYLVSVVQCFPLLTRTLQCLRGLRDVHVTSLYPHGWNTLKCLLSIAVVLTGLLVYNNVQIYFYMEVVCANGSKWWWDVVMDWGL